MRYAAIWPLLLGAFLSAADGAQTVLLERLIVIDISGSMDGEPLAEVRAELVKHLQAQPVSAATPVTFFTFSDDAHPEKHFTKHTDAVRFVESLRSDQGGTRIGAALEAAIDKLKNSAKLAHVMLMLYTDDQDPDRDAINRAEQGLAKLFHERSERGLAQAVYIRSWSSGGSLGDLVVTLGKNPHVAALGSDSPLTVVPVTIRPAVRIDRSVLDDDGTHLEVEFRAACGVGSVPQGMAVSPMKFRCLNPTADQPNEWEITPGASAKNCHLRLKLSEKELQAETIQLRFRVGPSTKPTADTTKRILPLLQQSELVVPVPFQADRRYEFAAKLVATGEVRWDPADAQRAIYKLDLLVGARPVGNARANTPIILALRGADSCQLVNGPPTVELTDQRAKPVAIELAVPLPQEVLQSGRGNVQAVIEVFPDKATRGVTFVKPLLRVTARLPNPPSATTHIEILPHSVSPALWYEPPDTGVVRVALDVNVNGPLPEDAKIILVGPPDVSNVRITPPTIHTGSQMVWLDVAAKLKPSPAQTELMFAVQPPPPTPLIRSTAPEKLTLKIAGPPPARLVAQRRRYAFSGDEVLAPTWANSADVSMMARLEGPIVRKFIEQLRIGLKAPATVLDAQPVITPYRWETVPVRLPPQDQASYFWDRTDVIQLELGAQPAASAVRPGSYSCRVVRQALFKRHLFLVLTMAAAIITPYLLVRLAASLRSTSDWREDELSTLQVTHESEPEI